MSLFDDSDLQAVNPTGTKAPKQEGIFDSDTMNQVMAASTPQKSTQQKSAEPEGFWGSALHSAAKYADTALSLPGQAMKGIDYAVRRAGFQNPEEAQTASEKDFPNFDLVGKATGVENTPSYKHPGIVGDVGDVIGGAVNTGVNKVADVTGMPKQDVANIANTLSFAAPEIGRTIAPGIKNVARKVGEVAQKVAAEDMERPIPPPSAFEQAKSSYSASPPERETIGGGAASTNPNPYPILTGEDTSRGAFPQIKTSKIANDISLPEQKVRSGIVNEIMGENAGQVRPGVVTGNENILRNEYAAAKSPNQTLATQAMKEQIANEQQALSNYAEKRVEATGANQTLLNNEQRGSVINEALYGKENSLTSYLKDAKNAIYEKARTTVGDNPIQTQHVNTLFSDPQFQAGIKLSGNEGTVAGAQELIQLASKTGFRDPVSGNVYAPGSIGAWDAVRKSLNSEWSQSNKNVIRQINNAIDNDIASAGGSEMYKLGDKIHQAEKTLLDSKGIGSVLGEYDANGIKTGTPLENIPSKLNSLPMDQWHHIHDTLEELSKGRIRGAPEGMPPVPSEVQQAATAAVKEMHGSLAREVYEAGANKTGVWNQNSSNKVLNSTVGQKIMSTFPPDEIEKFHTLNYGGQIMPGMHSYEGAGNQLQRLSNPGFIERYAPHAGASAGAAIGGAIPLPGTGPAGAMIGSKIGEKLSNLVNKHSEQKQLSKTIEELRRNSKLGEGKE